MRRSFTLLALVCAVALLGSACAAKKDTGFPAPSPSPSETATPTPTGPVELSGPIDIVDSAFEPVEGKIAVGGKADWKQSGSAPHSVTFDKLKVDSSPDCKASTPDKCLQSGSTFSATFPKSGKYHYYCRIHGAAGQDVGMYGYIVVE